MHTNYFSPAQVASRFSLRAGQQMNPATVTRWVLRGLIGPTGERIKLRATRIGRAIAISPADLDEFFAALAGDTDGIAPRSPAQRRVADSDAARELDRLGVGT